MGEHLEDTHEKPIRKHTHDTEGIRSLHDLVGGHTVTGRYPVVPLLFHGATLKYVPEESDKAPEDNDDETDSQYPDVYLLGRQSEQEETNAELDQHHVENVRGADMGRRPE